MIREYTVNLPTFYALSMVFIPDQKLNQKRKTIILEFGTFGHILVTVFNKEPLEREKERCSGSYRQAVGFLVIKDDSISERPG